jgi:hypothetical protein
MFPHFPSVRNRTETALAQHPTIAPHKQNASPIDAYRRDPQSEDVRAFPVTTVLQKIVRLRLANDFCSASTVGSM